jgi:hypothetical protein
MWKIIENVLTIIGIAMVFYWIPYLIRWGWNNAENRTKKVCDLCFRDIKRWNEEVKKLEERITKDK